MNESQNPASTPAPADGGAGSGGACGRIPAGLLGVLRKLLEAVPDPEIARLAAAVQGKGGFRPGARPALLRAGLANSLRADVVLSAALRLALRRHSLHPSLVAPFTPGFLKANLADLLAAFGTGPFLAALWFDERDAVHAIADDAIPRLLPEPPAADPQAAGEALGRLRALLGPFAAAGGADAAPAAANALADKAELADLRRENRRLREADDSLRRALEREQAISAELRALRDERDAARRESDAALRRIAALETDARRLRDENAHRIAAAVEHATASAFAGWLARASKVAADAAAPSGDSLEARAIAALENQAREDATSGSFRRLRDRLRDIDALRARARDALADAVHPLPSLQAAAGELDAEAIRLRALLGSGDDESAGGPTGEALLRAVSGATAESLPGIAETVDRLVALHALDDVVADRLREMLRLRQAIFHATTLPPALLGDDWEGLPADAPAQTLREALRGAGSAIVLVDGHNMLFALQSRYIPEGGGPRVPGRAARDKLVADFSRLVRGRPTVRVWIVFDGSEASDTAASDNVRVSYSGGEGEHRADRLLEANARYFRHAGAPGVLLVTNDAGLAGDARKAGASILAPTVFLPLFRNA